MTPQTLEDDIINHVLSRYLHHVNYDKYIFLLLASASLLVSSQRLERLVRPTLPKVGTVMEAMGHGENRFGNRMRS